MSDTYSTTELAAVLGLSGRRLRELAAEGVIPPAKKGRYPSATVADYCSYIRGIASGRTSAADEMLDFNKERALLARSQRHKIEQEMAVKAGELVDAREVTLKFAAMITRARTRLLGMGSAAKGRIPTLTVRDIEELEQLVVQALDELADDDD